MQRKNLLQRLPIHLKPVVDELQKRFRQQFGRDPGAFDPLFFDPDAEQPVPLSPCKLNQLWEQIADTWLSRGEISAEVAFAMKATGLFVRDEDKHLLSKSQQKQWAAALEEFRLFSNDETTNPPLPSDLLILRPRK